jgi:glycosyltransferase involved in cell wall biosynthesis
LANPRYSICITHFNNRPTVKQSLESLLNQIDERFEVVVVDNFSSDGSWEILQKYASLGTILLFRAKCSRGRGRQLAFEYSSGDYVISGIDLDVIFKPTLLRVIDHYHEACEGLLMGGGPVMAPREIIEGLGGWPDVQWGEDKYLWRKAADLGLATWVDRTYAIKGERRRFGGDRGSWYYLKYKYQCMRDVARVHGSLWRKIKQNPTLSGRVGLSVICLAGFVAAQFYKKYPSALGYRFARPQRRQESREKQYSLVEETTK